MADEATIHRTIERYLASSSAFDIDAVMSLFAPGGTIEDPVGSPIRRGHEEIRRFFLELWERLTSIEFRPLHIEVVGNEAAFSMEVRPVIGDQTLVMKAVDVMTFDDDARITSMRAYFRLSSLRPVEGEGAASPPRRQREPE